jgi:hypothetical protein
VIAAETAIYSLARTEHAGLATLRSTRDPASTAKTRSTATLVRLVRARASARYSGTVGGSVGSDTVNTRYLTASVELPLRDIACSAPGGS